MVGRRTPRDVALLCGLFSIGLLACPGCRSLAQYAAAEPDRPQDASSLDGSTRPADAAADDAGDDAAADAPSDGARPTDLGEDVLADSWPAGDLAPSDLVPVDLASNPKSDAPTPIAIDLAALSQQLSIREVPCVLADGTNTGTPQKLADTNKASYCAWSTLKGSLPAQTLQWVGVGSAAAVVWDLNACDDEDWQNSADDDWATAGLVIRGATISTSGQLLLAPGTTFADMNLVDLSAGCGWEGDDFGPLDQGLPPNLVEPVEGMKRLLIDLAGL